MTTPVGGWRCIDCGSFCAGDKGVVDALAALGVCFGCVDLKGESPEWAKARLLRVLREAGFSHVQKGG